MECCAVIAAVGIVGTAICLAAADDSSYSTHNYYTTTPVYTKPSNYYIPPVIEIEIQQYENTKPIYPYPSSKPSLMTSLNGSHYYDYDYLLNSSSSYYDKKDIFNSKYDAPVYPYPSSKASFNNTSFDTAFHGNAFSDLPVYPYPSSKSSLMTSLNGSHYYDYDYLLNSSSSYYDKEDIFNSKYDRPIHPSYNTNSGTLYGNAFSDLPVYPYPSSKPSLLTSYNDTYYN